MRETLGATKNQFINGGKMSRKNKFRYIQLILIIIIIVFISSCSEPTSKDNNMTLSVSGLSEKGPFVVGSTVVIQELNDNFSPNGISYNVSTNDDFGSFQLETEVSTNYVEMICTGYYFHEVMGGVTNSTITLRTIVPSDNSVENINILTTLASKRIKYLINNTELDFFEAKLQAEEEVLSIFNIIGSNINFGQMNFRESGVLIAISSILGCGNPADTSVLISSIVEDIETDGIVDNPEIHTTIRENSRSLSPNDIRNNIEERFASLGIVIILPEFTSYIRNCWGSGYVLYEMNDNPYCESSRTTCTVFNNKLIVYDAEINTISFTEDGETWEILSDDLPFTGTFYDNQQQTYYSLLLPEPVNDKIWIQDIMNNLWCSSDGILWEDTGIEWIVNDTNSYPISLLYHDNKIWCFTLIELYALEEDQWVLKNSPFSNYYVHESKNKFITFNNNIITLPLNDSSYFSGDGISWEEFSIPGNLFCTDQAFGKFDNSLFLFDRYDTYKFGNNNWVTFSEIENCDYYASNIEYNDLLWFIGYNGKISVLEYIE